MPSMKWSERTGLEIGRYAEYYANQSLLDVIRTL